MSTVRRIDGSLVEHVRLTDVRQVGNEGSKTAIGHIGDEAFPVYQSIIDGFTQIWDEQLGDTRDYETNPWSLTNRNGYWHD